MTLIAVTYGYARVSKTDDESKKLDIQLLLLAEHGIRSDLVHSDVTSGRNLQRTGWQELMSRVQEGDTIVVAFLDRLSRNFENGVRIQAELTRSNIGIVAIRENIDTREGSAGAKFFRRSMPAQGAYQVDSASERIRMSLDQSRASGKRGGRPPVLSNEQAEQCRRMAGAGRGFAPQRPSDGLLARHGEDDAGTSGRIGRGSGVPKLTAQHFLTVRIRGKTDAT